MKAKKMSLFFLFFSIFCSESEDEGQKERINWGTLITHIQQKGNITPTQEAMFRVVKTGVRCFLKTPYDQRYRPDELSLGDSVLMINEQGLLECRSFVGIIHAILLCKKSKNIRLAELWKLQISMTLDALTSGILIPRENVPNVYLQEADAILVNRAYPIIAEEGREVPDERAMVSRMASVQSTPVSSPERRIGAGGVQHYFMMPPCHHRSDSGSADQ